jgi:hypothetical protein
MIFEEDHYMKDYPHREFVAKYLQNTSQPVQQQHLVVKNPAPLQGGNIGHSHHGYASTSAFEVYMFKMIYVTTQENTYDTPPSHQPKGKVVDQPSSSTPPPYSIPLQTTKPISDVVLHPPKSIIRKETINRNSCATQNYNIVEYLAQAPCPMLDLKVLQHCPS